MIQYLLRYGYKKHVHFSKKYLVKNFLDIKEYTTQAGSSILRLVRYIEAYAAVTTYGILTILSQI